jgi:hypothetical protein
MAFKWRNYANAVNLIDSAGNAAGVLYLLGYDAAGHPFIAFAAFAGLPFAPGHYEGLISFN